MKDRNQDHPARLDDQRLGELLRGLPREEAREDFTAQTLARLSAAQEGPRERRDKPGLPLPWLAAAAIVVLALGLAGLQGLRGPEPASTTPHTSITGLDPLTQRQEERREALALLENLRSEYRALEAELTSIRASKGEMVYVGGNEEVDLVVDLVQLAAHRSPATYRGSGRPDVHRLPNNRL